MHYWGICMYGVQESCIRSGNISFDEIFDELDEREVKIEIGNQKSVNLVFEPTEDDNYLGFIAGYPWDFKNTEDENLTSDDVKNAIAQFLELYGYDPEEVKNVCDEISTYNCG